MKQVVFCGFGELGKKCLELLQTLGFEIKLVMTHKELEESSVDTYSEKMGYPLTYLDSRKNMDLVTGWIKEISPDYLVSINYRYIIPKEIIEIPIHSLNIHGSLLPQYRGRTPHVWSIINGEHQTGITCHLIEETVDSGDIISQKAICIDYEDTGYTVLDKFKELYPIILKESLEKLEKGEVLLKQDEEMASYYGKRIPEMGYINFYCQYEMIRNFVRAQASPYPGAYYYLSDGRRIIINRIEKYAPTDIDLVNIGVITCINDKLYVKCIDALIHIKEYTV